MAQVINPALIMNVTFEHPTIIFDNKIAEVFYMVNDNERI